MLARLPAYQRRVYHLAIAAAVLILVAIAAVILTRAPTRTAFKPEPYFPELGAEAQQIKAIHIQDKTGKTDLSYAPETGWVVTDKDGYKARTDKIEALIQNLRELVRFEKRTDDPKWQKHLLLTDPREKDGEASLVQLFDKSGKALAELLIGVNADVDEVGGKAQMFVRKPGDNQVWLAQGEGLSPLSADGSNWLNTSIISVPKSRIARAEINVQGAPPYALVHAKPDDEHFSIENMPAGMKVKTDYGVDNVGNFLNALDLRDVASADRITFTPDATSATFYTYNGLKIAVATTKLGNDTWIKLVPSTTDKADDQAKKEAADLARRLSPWVYQIESWKADQLGTKLDGLIESVNAPKSTPAAEIMAPPGKSTQTSSHTLNKSSTVKNLPPSEMAPASHAENQKSNHHVDNKSSTSRPQ